jgi:hypothetical protein
VHVLVALVRKNGMSTVLNSHAAHPEILATYTDAALHGKRGKDSIGEAQIDEAVVLIVELLPYLSVRGGRGFVAATRCVCRLLSPAR